MERELKGQGVNLKDHMAEQKGNLKEAEEHLENFQEKKQAVEKHHRNMHKSKLHKYLQQFPDSVDPVEYLETKYNKKRKIEDVSEEETDKDEDEVLEKAKQKMGKKLTKIVEQQNVVTVNQVIQRAKRVKKVADTCTS